MAKFVKKETKNIKKKMLQKKLLKIISIIFGIKKEDFVEVLLIYVYITNNQYKTLIVKMKR